MRRVAAIGNGVVKDNAEAVRWYRKAADLDAVAVRPDGRAGDVRMGGMGRKGGYKQGGNEAA